MLFSLAENPILEYKKAKGYILASYLDLIEHIIKNNLKGEQQWK